jgi:CDP-diacylglycerol--glycerol-3-phosphate 3-phosphatidyltransferase
MTEKKGSEAAKTAIHLKAEIVVSLANKITIVRIMSIPLLILVLLYYIAELRTGADNVLLRGLALFIFVLVAGTDALDGYLARSRGEVTAFGRILDPLADKALMLSSLIVLTRPSIPALEPHIPVWFTLLVISRDVVLILGAMLIHFMTGRVEVAPRFSGKGATLFQILAIVWVLARGPVMPFMVLVAIAGMFTFMSGALYVFDGIRQLEHGGRQ